MKSYQRWEGDEYYYIIFSEKQNNIHAHFAKRMWKENEKELRDSEDLILKDEIIASENLGKLDSDDFAKKAEVFADKCGFYKMKEKVKSEIVAKAGLTKSEVRKCAYLWEHIEDVEEFLKFYKQRRFKIHSNMFLTNAQRDFQALNDIKKGRLNSKSKAIQIAHRLVYEYCTKLFYTAYKTAIEREQKRAQNQMRKWNDQMREWKDEIFAHTPEKFASECGF